MTDDAPLGVYCAEVGVLEEVHEVGLRRLRTIRLHRWIDRWIDREGIGGWAGLYNKTRKS